MSETFSIRYNTGSIVVWRWRISIYAEHCPLLFRFTAPPVPVSLEYWNRLSVIEPFKLINSLVARKARIALYVHFSHNPYHTRRPVFAVHAMMPINGTVGLDTH